MKRTSKLFLALLAAAGLANAGDYSSWSSYRLVTLNTTAMTLSANVTNIPLLVRFDATNHKDMLDSADTQVQADGSDIRVTKIDGVTDVPFEIEHVSTGASGALHLWILADEVSASNASAAAFRVYWGKEGQTSMSDGSAVFSTSNGYQAVFHLNDEAGDVTDVANGYTGTAVGTAPNTSAAISGAARDFTISNDGAADPTVTNNYISFAPDATDDLSTHTGPITMEAWVRSSIGNFSNSSPGTKTIISHKLDSLEVAWLKRDGGGPQGTANNQYYRAGGDTANLNGPLVPGGEKDAWHYVVGTWDGTAWTVVRQRTSDAWGLTSLTIEGVVQPSMVRTEGGDAPVASTQPWFIGGWSDDGTADGVITRGWRGQLDEVRVSTVSRDTNFLELSFETSKLAPSAITIGSTEVPPPPVAGPYEDWNGHKNIVLNTSATGANVAGDVYDFPVLIRLGAAELSILGAAKAGGADIRFSKADDATPLPYQIESWSPTAAAIWVKVDTILGNNSTQSIRMHWGNGDATSESNGAAVFDTTGRFRAVWHLNETASPAIDATPLATDAVWMNTPAGAEGNIGGAINIANPNGTSSANGKYLRAAYNVANNNFKTNKTDGLTLSAWVNRTSDNGQANQGFAGRWNWNGGNRRQSILEANATSWQFAVSPAGAGNNEVTVGDVPVVNGEWVHVLATYRDGAQTLYVNGVADTTLTLAVTGLDSTWSAAPFLIGRMETNNCCLQGIDARIDEVRLSDTTRSAAWIKLEYENQKAENSLANIGLPVYTAPGQPTNVTAVGGDAEATISWTAPANDGGKPITGYTVSTVNNPGLSCTTTGALTCMVTGLSNGTFYTFTVQAENEIGLGAASGASNAVVPNPVSNNIYAAWTNSRSIVLNTSATGANIPGDVHNFPVLVRLGSNESAILSAANNGNSIRFAKSDSTVALPYQIESWGANSAAIWVKVDTIKGNNATQSILMFWGNGSAASESNGAAVFDTANGFRAVWHLSEAEGDDVVDATGSGNNGTASDSLPKDTTGLIGGAKQFNGDSWYQIGTDSTAVNLDIDDPSGLTISAWVNPSSCEPDRIAAFSKYTSTGTSPLGRQYSLHTGNTSTNWRFTVGSPAVGTGEFYVDAENTCVTGSWRHVVGTYASADTATADSAVNVRIYVDGIRMGSGALATIEGVGTGANTYIGRVHNNTRYMKGRLDEITVAAVRRDSNWIKLMYQSQRLMQAFSNIGVTPPNVPGAPTSVFASLSSSTTGAATISWVAPQSNGGAAITKYTVTGTPSGSCETTGATTCPVTGLTVGQAHTFTVVATNSAGNSAASSPSNTITPVTGINTFVIRMDGTGNPYSYRMSSATAANTEKLTMTISDMKGKHVWSRTINPSQGKVTELTWNGRNATGMRVSAGMYIVRINVTTVDGETFKGVRKGVNLKP